MAVRREDAAGGGARMLARVVALLALAGAVLAVVLIISSTLAEDEPPPRGGPGVERSEQQPQRATPDAYEVEPGDTLTGIADRFGVPIERLRRLNPDVDPQGLVAGQEIRLRRSR